MLDVFRVRQYFDVLTRLRDLGEGVREDAGFVGTVGRALLPVPSRARDQAGDRVFDEEPAVAPLPPGRRVGFVSTGGSGALASVVGVARAFEELGIRPAVMSLCSGSALFGFPVAAGVPAADVASFVASLRPDDYVDVDWRRLALLAPTRLRGFAGVIRGDRLESTLHDFLGDRTLAEMPIPAYAPIWNIEENRLEYLGPRTHPDVTVAHAIRMALSLPLFIAPVALDGFNWCDGGLVDIFPVDPLLSIEPRCDVVVAVNGFYPPEFAGEDATGWADRTFSILSIASQVRTCQQVELARVNLARLRRATRVVMLDPVPYEKVRGVGFYRQFLDTSEWPSFMRAGHRDARRALRELARSEQPVTPRHDVMLTNGSSRADAARRRSTA